MRARTFCVVAVVLAAVTSFAQSSAPRAAAAGAAAEVLAFERTMEAAVVRGDVASLDAMCAPDFTFTHGDGWTTGGEPLRVETKAQWLASVSKAPYLSRDLDAVQVEMHGDIAKNKSAAPGRAEFTVWFERVYALRDGRWQYVSHRTVHGPTYATRATAAK